LAWREGLTLKLRISYGEDRYSLGTPKGF